MKITDIPTDLLARLRGGTVIPAHPLALTSSRSLDERRQRALTRYYVDAGAGGIAVGVHTTQFAIRDHGLYRGVLTLAAETASEWGEGDRGLFCVAGACGKTAQAVAEAGVARELGYHACLLNLGALVDENASVALAHCREVAEVMPVFGFYLQAQMGGCALPYRFWRDFVEIDNVVAIKIAAFNRYDTFDVVRALGESTREREIALYTGNDDTIVIDLLSEYRIDTSSGPKTVRFVGGLLGHWAVWTRAAVEFLNEVRAIARDGVPVPQGLLTAAGEVTDANAAFFDAANGFRGSVPGILEVLRRQGLVESAQCLDPKETLSPGQSEEIDRVLAAYPHWSDDEFVRTNLDRWLG